MMLDNKPGIPGSLLGPAVWSLMCCWTFLPLSQLSILSELFCSLCQTTGPSSVPIRAVQSRVVSAGKCGVGRLAIYSLSENPLSK